MKSQVALGRDLAGGRAMPAISIALCTWNGSAFLQEQLQSLAAQTLAPSELVIHDDCSSDDSVEIAQKFANGAPFRVRVRRNARNLGIRENFSDCIGACAGRIIALSDQDDVWMPDKLERLCRSLNENPGAAFVFSDALLVDRDLRPMASSLWQSLRFSGAQVRHFQEGRGLEVLLNRNVVTGATMAFRACYRDLLLPVPVGWLHDEWIALILSSIAWGAPVDAPLIRYRQHGRQEIGGRRRNLYQQFLVARQMTRDDFRRDAEACRAATERLQERAAGADRAIHMLRQKTLHLERRTRIHDRRALRWPLVFREWWTGNYAKYSPGWKAVAQDLFL